MRNNAQYAKRGYTEVGLFIYRGTTALKKGYGMCYDLDYLTTETDETAADPFGGRGLVEIAVPAASNANRFAGVLTQNYPATQSGKQQLIELALPGSCAMVAQRIISTSGVTRVTCIVDRTAGQGLSGMFGHGGLGGRGSAIALQTLAAATAGKLALTNVTGVATGVYSAATGLTTVTLAAAGTALGYVAASVDASSYELTVLGGATAGTGVTRCTPGIYPVRQATGANTFTVEGNTGDGAMMTFLTKKDLLMLAFLEDGPESGLSEYVVPITGAAQQFVLTQGGTTFICGGITIAGDCTINTLADPITIGGGGEGTKKAFATLGNTVTSDYIITVTSGIVDSDTTTTMATIVMQNATACEVVLEWHGNFGPNTGGVWHDLHHVGATFT
jgi:hypothetical protein